MLRDDIVEYSLDAHHDEAQGKKLRAKIWKVTGILTLITAIEVITGIFIKQHSSSWELVKWGFIILTIVKAGYIVLSFMHLGDEKKTLKYMILVPYFIFMIYLIFILIVEANAVDAALKLHQGF
ncbi:MAG: cytochrome C oxidase subunit IV family protein [Flavobacteriia bacterium]|jgi:cytochrome c oxidase subunit 4